MEGMRASGKCVGFVNLFLFLLFVCFSLDFVIEPGLLNSHLHIIHLQLQDGFLSLNTTRLEFVTRLCSTTSADSFVLSFLWLSALTRSSLSFGDWDNLILTCHP